MLERLICIFWRVSRCIEARKGGAVMRNSGLLRTLVLKGAFLFGVAVIMAGGSVAQDAQQWTFEVPYRFMNADPGMTELRVVCMVRGLGADNVEHNIGMEVSDPLERDAAGNVSGVATIVVRYGENPSADIGIRLTTRDGLRANRYECQFVMVGPNPGVNNRQGIRSRDGAATHLRWATLTSDTELSIARGSL